MHRVQLDNREFEGANAVYLLGAGDDGPTTLVDTATAQPVVRTALADELAAVGVSVADIDQVLLTHFHGDHAGGAGAVQAASDAVVRVHEADAPLVTRDPTALAEYEDRHAALFDRWGMPESAAAELRASLADDALWSDSDADVEPFTDGERFAVGDRTVEVWHLPGHTVGQCGFVLDDGDERALFSGDALLPKYTPNVGGADVRDEDALQNYLDALVRIVEGGFDVAYPGHREPIEEPAERARHILDHHRERTGRVVDVLAEHGPADAWTVSAHLFGDLAGIHILHGPGEAYAHLEHLRTADHVAVSDSEYELLDGEPDVDALFPQLGGIH
ncbi:MBL fold metallo-hydrolase [Haloarchaeobius baliensis]|uniref:MBL fold metallo-hydrolase n=1 Tax=Haloarchaeobius baliensis TaxID=1670458 RepID=UPI003F882356